MWRGAFPVVDRQLSNRQKSPSGRSHNREKTNRHLSAVRQKSHRQKSNRQMSGPHYYYVRTYVLGTYTLNFHHKKEFTHSKSPIHSKFPILTLGFFCSLLQLTTKLRGAKMQSSAATRTPATQRPDTLQCTQASVVPGHKTPADTASGASHTGQKRGELEGSRSRFQNPPP